MDTDHLGVWLSSITQQVVGHLPSGKRYWLQSPVQKIKRKVVEERRGGERVRRKQEREKEAREV